MGFAGGRDGMIEVGCAPRGHLPRYAPSVHRGDRNTEGAGYCRLTASRLDLRLDHVIHGSKHAIIARDAQAPICDKRKTLIGVNLDVCENGDSDMPSFALERGMDMLAAKRRMLELGFTQGKVAKHLGIDESAVSKLFAGKRQLKAHEAAKLAQLLDLDDLGFTTIRQLPVIGFISAGSWQSSIEQPLYMMPSPEAGLPVRSFGVVVEGDSMDRIVVAGATLIIDPDDLDLVSKGIYAVRNGGGETVVKQFLNDPARLEPLSNNAIHRTIFPGRDGFEVIGRVIWKAERLR